MAVGHGRGAQDRDGDRRVLKVGFTLGGGDDDLLQGRAVVGRRRVGGIGALGHRHHENGGRRSTEIVPHRKHPCFGWPGG